MLKLSRMTLCAAEIHESAIIEYEPLLGVHIVASRMTLFSMHGYIIIMLFAIFQNH